MELKSLILGQVVTNLKEVSSIKHTVMLMTLLMLVTQHLNVGDTFVMLVPDTSVGSLEAKAAR